MDDIQRPELADLHRYRPAIRFSDIDAMGIVNNAVFLTYFEESRVHFFSHLIQAKWDWNSAGVVVARHEISYRNPIRYLAEVEIFTWAARLGGKSLDMAYEVWVDDQNSGRGPVLAAEATTTLVAYNHLTGKSCAVPEAWVRPLERVGLGRPQLPHDSV